MRWLAVVSLLCAGCNLAFGLDKTDFVDTGPDQDDDGVPNELDNCLSVANGLQEDTDADGRGDACDGCDGCMACDHGADHDEDGDTLMDGCDNCPAQANPDQANVDSDDLGDACDADAEFERRILFDGFGMLGEEWLESGSQWVVTDGDVGPLVGLTSGLTAQLQHSTAAIPSGRRWAIEISMAPLDLDRSRGFYVGSSTICYLERLATGEYRIQSGATKGAPFTANLDAGIRFRMTPTGLLGAQFAECSIPGIATHADTLLELQYPLSVQLTTSRGGPQFHYAEAIIE